MCLRLDMRPELLYAGGALSNALPQGLILHGFCIPQLTLLGN